MARLKPTPNRVRARVAIASCVLAVPSGVLVAMLLYGQRRWSYPRWVAAAVTGLAVAGRARRRIEVHRRRDLRPDLHDVVLELDHVATLALLPGEDATLQVESVRPTEDPAWVLVAGGWCGPDGDDGHARVEVRASALPKSKVAAR